MTKVEEIDSTGLTEDQFIEKAVAAIGEVKKTDSKLLTKDTFIKVFKYSGDFAKMRSRALK